MPPLPPDVLECLRRAGRVAAEVRALGARWIVPGALVREVCGAVEDEVVSRGCGVAFPVQSSLNHVAAHYCASPEDPTRYAEGDLAKLDIGVHVDGWVVDTALTVNVGDRPEHRPLVEAARAALEDAISAARPGVAVKRLSTAIADRVRSFGLRPMQNLCGHGVGRWTVHRPPPIPNTPDDYGDRLEPGAVVAIEPFVTAGRGEVTEEGPAEVFRVDPTQGTPSGSEPDVMEAIAAYRGLPFSRRQLRQFPPAAVERALAALRAQGRLIGYPPLAEKTRRPVAQAEHTIYVGREGVEVLTR
jgi:methionyl aminopeptidase